MPTNTVCNHTNYHKSSLCGIEECTDCKAQREVWIERFGLIKGKWYHLAKNIKESLIFCNHRRFVIVVPIHGVEYCKDCGAIRNVVFHRKLYKGNWHYLQ
jgi:hypothetical protein